jgi:hypothetical protein
MIRINYFMLLIPDESHEESRGEKVFSPGLMRCMYARCTGVYAMYAVLLERDGGACA